MLIKIPSIFNRLVLSALVCFGSVALADIGTLNGIATHTELNQEIFIGALYLPQNEKDPLKVIAMSGPKTMEMRISAPDLSPRKFGKLWNESIMINNSPEDVEKYGGLIVQFTSSMKGKLITGDQVQITLRPEKATVLLVNGAEMATFSPELFNLVLRTWIGPRPVTTEFKQNILAGNSKPAQLSKFEAIVPIDGRKQAIAGWGTGSDKSAAVSAEAQKAADAKAKAEADAKAKADLEARVKAEADAKAKADAEAKAKADTEAKAIAEAKLKAEAEAKQKAEAKALADAQAAAEAKAKAEAQLRAKAELEAKAKAESEAKARADAEAKAKADMEASAKAEADAKAKAEAAAKTAANAADAAAKAKAEQEAKAAADAAKAATEAKAAAEAKGKLEAEARAKAEQEAKVKAEQAAKANAEAEAKATAEAKAREEAKIASEAKSKAAADEKAKAEAEAKASAEAKATADEKAKIAAEAKAKAEADAKLAAEAKAAEASKAKASQPATPVAAADKPAKDDEDAADAGGEAAQIYRSKLVAWTYKHLDYPEKEKDKRHEGDVRIRVTINRGGIVTNSEVLEQTKSAVLNFAANNTVKRSMPYPVMPEEVVGDSFTFEVPIRFRASD